MCIIEGELVGQGRIEGKQEGQLDAVSSLVKNRLLKLEDAATFLNVTIEEMRMKMGQANGHNYSTR